jgi:hypothetical protein
VHYWFLTFKVPGRTVSGPDMTVHWQVPACPDNIAGFLLLCVRIPVRGYGKWLQPLWGWFYGKDLDISGSNPFVFQQPLVVKNFNEIYNFVNEGFRFVLIFVSLGPIRWLSLQYFAKILLCMRKLKGIAPSLSVFYPNKFLGNFMNDCLDPDRDQKKLAESIKR